MAPKIKTPLKDIIIKAGKILNVEIQFIGEPPPECTWTIDAKELKTDSVRTTVTSIGYHTIVNTVNAKRTDSGTYHLELRNSSGRDEGSFTVTVLGKCFFLDLGSVFIYTKLTTVIDPSEKNDDLIEVTAVVYFFNLFSV